eukprot:Plantae.Rhodophyta-Palmaria_palmata.ctg5955.p1 GENE.Plantae.Rhodophyta-Palmaria_palmata.ctg5955~~Plantae.Rhodophyta-Palmaria_palmata.ctg5955.p1  ORF type:complete len:296 (+),score=29.01 Plantae.Rhodophyta-Palmaria_palmata.ctg5955:187-1074(+)
MRTMRKYARPNNGEFPKQDGGDIEAEMQGRIGLTVQACTAKVSEKHGRAPLRLPRNIAEARGQKDWLMWAKDLDDELDRHGPGHLHTFDFVDSLPTDKPIPYTLTLKVKTNQFEGSEKHKVRLSIREDRMRPGIDFDETRTQSHMPTQSGRRLLVLAGVAEGHSFRSLDVPGAFMRAPNEPNIRVVMAQPTRSNGTPLHSGKICLLRRAMPGEKSANQNWDSWRDYLITNWGLTKVLAEPNMFGINTENDVARLEADRDDFFFSAPSDADLDKLSQPFIDAWQCTIQKLEHGQAI